MPERQPKSVEWIASLPRWTAEDAQIVLDAAERSGLGLGRFAELHGLDAQRLYRWSRELRARAREPEPVGFAELVVPRSGESAPCSAEPFEIVLQSGHVVRVRATFDPEALRRLLAVLEGPSTC